MKLVSIMTMARTLAATLALLVTPTVYGTQTLRMSFEQIVAGSDAIVHGTVARSWTAWDETHRSIWTHYEIAVADTLKGEPGPKIVVSEPGGELDGVHMQIVGTPVYEVGEEVVLFAAPTPIGYLRTCGWGQGRFAVRSERGVKTVAQGAMRAEVVEAGKQAPSQRALSTVGGSSLEQFKAMIRDEVVRQGR